MNKTKAFLLGAALLVAAGTSVLQAETPVRVTADNVNLRAKAVANADVVGQVAYDTRLTAFEIGEEWVEVAAPAAADVWVMKSFVVSPGNTIGANRVNVRAGPSINYNIVATLSLGDVVEPRGEELQDWIKIAPPPAAHVFISRDYVEILSGDTAKPEIAEKPAEIAQNAEITAENAEISKKKADLSEKTAEIVAEEAKNDEKASKKSTSKAKTEEKAVETAAAVIPTPLVSPSVPVKDSAVREIPVPPPANLKLIPLEGQGRITEVEGELRAAPLINEAPTRYRVVRWQNNRWQILCHVYGEAAKFRSLQDKRVSLKGREYWIQGAAAPVLIPDQVLELPPAGEGAPADLDLGDDPVVH